MIQIEVKEKNNRRLFIGLVIFIFSMMFSFEIAGINMRYAVLAFWLAVCLVRTHKIRLSKKLFFIPGTIASLLVYAVVISLIQGSDNTFEFLRFLRAILTYFIIYLFLSSGRYSKEQIMRALLIVLGVHAASIVLGIAFPQIKVILQPISQYSKEFMAFRSTGLLSGYDDAGFLCNVGLIMYYIHYKHDSKLRLSIGMLFFSAAAALTSRFNMLCMAIIFCIILLLEFRSKGLWKKLFVTFLVLVGGTFVFVFWVLTTNVNLSLREYIIGQFPILSQLYSAVLGSYTDYGVYTKVIARHWFPGNISFLETISGAGYRPRSDIGYVNTIYSIGTVGIVTQLVMYYKSYKYVKRTATPMNVSSNYVLIYSVALLLMLIMEFKTSLIFSSTTFEMMTVLYLSIVLTEKVNYAPSF